MKRHSGLQKQVLAIYKDFLKEAKKKADSKTAILMVRNKFRQKASWPKRDVSTIEHWLRKAKKELQVLKKEETKKISVFTIEREEEKGEPK